MSTSNADRSPTPPPEPGRIDRWLHPLTLLGVGLGGCAAVVATSVLTEEQGGLIGGWQLPTFLLSGTVFVTLLARIWSTISRAERDTVGESRRRLARAEGALAEALRDSPDPRDLVLTTGLVPPPDVERDSPPELPLPHAPPPTVDEEKERQRALALPELWETTHARLGLYHDIATGQAKTSFRNAQVSMAAGFILLVLFVVLALNASTTAGAIVAGGLGAVSAALAGYVSRTFIRSQEAAATHLRSYFDQPLELSRYLAAERLISDGGLTQEQRSEVLSALVRGDGRSSGAAAAAGGTAPVPGQPGA